MPRKNAVFLRGISLFLVGAVCLQEISWATPSVGAIHESPLQIILRDPARFEAPIQFSTLKEIHQGHLPGGETPPLLIHIQDAHSNLSGQENLAKTLDEIMKKYKVYTVLVEGSSKDSTLDPIKALAPSKQILERTARSFLVQGKIAGEEYLNLTSDHPMQILGIEDRSLYMQSIENYAKLAKKREETLAYLKKIQIAVEKLKSKLYPKELLGYEKTKGNTDQEMKALLNLSSPSMLDRYPNLQVIKTLQDKEEQIDFNLANLEQAALIEKLGRDEREKLLKIQRAAKSENRLSQLAFFQNAFNIAKDKQIDLTKYPNWTAYGKYLEEFSAVDLEKLIDETEAMENEVYSKRLADTDIKLVRAIDRYLKLLETAYKIQMSTKDFETFQVNEPNFATLPYLSFINRKLAETGYFEDLLEYKDYFEKGKKALQNFYSSVAERDIAFIQNTERLIKDQSPKIAVLISGGYHTQHLKELFEEKGYSYVVLTPNVTSETNQKKYEELLLSPFKKEIALKEDAPREFKPTTQNVKAPEAAMIAASRLAEFGKAMGVPSARLSEAIRKIEARPDGGGKLAAARLAGRYSSSLRSGGAARGYYKGLTAQSIMARAREKNIAAETIVASLRQAGSREDLFGEWEKLHLIDPVEKNSITPETAENLVLGVWYAVSQEVYPYKREGQRAWEATLIEGEGNRIAINGVVHGNMLLRGHSASIRRVVGDASQTDELILFEENLGGLYRIGYALEMDDHLIFRLVKEVIKKERKKAAEIADSKRKDIVIDPAMNIFGFATGLMFLAMGASVYFFLDDKEIELVFGPMSSSREFIALWAATGAGMTFIFGAQIPAVRRAIRAVLGPVIGPIVRYAIKKTERIVDFFVRSFFRAIAIAQDANTGIIFLAIRTRNRFFQSPPADPFGIARLVSIEAIMDAIFLTNENGDFSKHYRTDLPMPVAQIFGDAIDSQEDLGKINWFNRSKKKKVQNFVMTVLRSVYMAEWAHQAALSGIPSVRLVVGLGHEEQIAYFIDKPEKRREILAKYLGEPQYEQLVSDIRQKLSSYKNSPRPVIDEATARRIRRQEMVEIAVGGVLLVAGWTLLSQLPVNGVGLVSSIFAATTAVLLAGAVILHQVYRGNSDAIRKTVVGASRGFIFFMLTASVTSVFSALLGIGFAYAALTGAAVTLAVFLGIRLYENRHSLTTQQKDALQDEAVWLSGRMASVGVDISPDELMRDVDQTRFYSHIVAFASAKNVRFYLMRNILSLAAIGLAIYIPPAVWNFEPASSMDAVRWPYAKWTAAALFALYLAGISFLGRHSQIDKQTGQPKLSAEQSLSLFGVFGIGVLSFSSWFFSTGFVHSVLLPGIQNLGLVWKAVFLSLAAGTLFVYYKISRDEKGFYDRGLGIVSLNPAIDEDSLRTNAVYYWTKLIAEREAWRTLGSEDRDLREGRLSYVIAALRALERGHLGTHAEGAITGTVSQRISRFIGDESRTADTLNLPTIDEATKRTVESILERYDRDFTRIWQAFPEWFDEMIFPVEPDSASGARLADRVFYAAGLQFYIPSYAADRTDMEAISFPDRKGISQAIILSSKSDPSVRFIIKRPDGGRADRILLRIENHENVSEQVFSLSELGKERISISDLPLGRRFLDILLNIDGLQGPERARKIRDFLLNLDTTQKAYHYESLRSASIGKSTIINSYDVIQNKILIEVLSERQKGNRFLLWQDKLRPDWFVVLEEESGDIRNVATGEVIVFIPDVESRPITYLSRNASLAQFVKFASRQLSFSVATGKSSLLLFNKRPGPAHIVALPKEREFGVIKVSRSNVESATGTLDAGKRMTVNDEQGGFPTLLAEDSIGDSEAIPSDVSPESLAGSPDYLVIRNSRSQPLPLFIGYSTAFGEYDYFKKLAGNEHVADAVLYKKLKTGQPGILMVARMAGEEGFYVDGIVWKAGPLEGQPVLFQRRLNPFILALKYSDGGILSIPKALKEFSAGVYEYEEHARKKFMWPALAFENNAPVIRSARLIALRRSNLEESILWEEDALRTLKSGQQEAGTGSTFLDNSTEHVNVITFGEDKHARHRVKLAENVQIATARASKSSSERSWLTVSHATRRERSQEKVAYRPADYVDIADLKQKYRAQAPDLSRIKGDSGYVLVPSAAGWNPPDFLFNKSENAYYFKVNPSIDERGQATVIYRRIEKEDRITSMRISADQKRYTLEGIEIDGRPLVFNAGYLHLSAFLTALADPALGQMPPDMARRIQISDQLRVLYTSAYDELRDGDRAKMPTTLIHSSEGWIAGGHETIWWTNPDRTMERKSEGEKFKRKELLFRGAIGSLRQKYYAALSGSSAPKTEHGGQKFLPSGARFAGRPFTRENLPGLSGKELKFLDELTVSGSDLKEHETGKPMQIQARDLQFFTYISFEKQVNGARLAYFSTTLNGEDRFYHEVSPDRASDIRRSKDVLYRQTPLAQAIQTSPNFKLLSVRTEKDRLDRFAFEKVLPALLQTGRKVVVQYPVEVNFRKSVELYGQFVRNIQPIRAAQAKAVEEGGEQQIFIQFVDSSGQLADGYKSDPVSDKNIPRMSVTVPSPEQITRAQEMGFGIVPIEEWDGVNEHIPFRPDLPTLVLTIGAGLLKTEGQTVVASSDELGLLAQLQAQLVDFGSRPQVLEAGSRLANFQAMRFPTLGQRARLGVLLIVSLAKLNLDQFIQLAGTRLAAVSRAA